MRCRCLGLISWQVNIIVNGLVFVWVHNEDCIRRVKISFLPGPFETKLIIPLFSSSHSQVFTLLLGMVGKHSGIYIYKARDACNTPGLGA